MDDPVPTKKQLSPLLSLFCHLRKVGLRAICCHAWHYVWTSLELSSQQLSSTVALWGHSCLCSVEINLAPVCSSGFYFIYIFDIIYNLLHIHQVAFMRKTRKTILRMALVIYPSLLVADKACLPPVCKGAGLGALTFAKHHAWVTA